MSRKSAITATNYVVLLQEELRQRHYILNSPGHARRWVAFSPRKIASYRERYNDDFCVVITGDPSIAGDFYAIPWDQIAELFVADNAYHVPSKNGRVSTRWQLHLEGPPHFFQFELARTDQRQRPRFNATAWYGNYAALEEPTTDHRWQLAELVSQDNTFPEGRRKAVLHYRRERNPNLVQLAKTHFLTLHGRLYCEVCGFDFHNVYGDLGDGFIEAHHMLPLKTLTEHSETRIEDLAMVCANCHRMLHRGERWLSVPELAARIAASEGTEFSLL